MSEINFNIYIKIIINLHIYKLKCQLRNKSPIIFNTSYNNYKCKRSEQSKDDKIKSIAQWIYKQKLNSKTRKHIMKSDEIYNTWIQFITHDDYKQYFKPKTVIVKGKSNIITN